MLDISFYIIIGCLSGFLSGLLGIGGGTVIVPVLSMIFLHQNLPFSEIMHLAIGSSLMIMFLTSHSAMRAYDKRGFIEWPLFRRFLPGILTGTICGVIIAKHLSTEILSSILGVMLILIAIRMLFFAKPNPQSSAPGAWLHNFVSLVTGLMAGLLGLGGGVITIPYLIGHNVSMHKAVGISTACSMTIATIGAATFMLTGLHAAGLPAYSTGYVYWPAVIGIALPSMLFTPLGAQLSQRLSATLLNRLFSLFLLIVAFKMI